MSPPGLTKCPSASIPDQVYRCHSNSNSSNRNNNHNKVKIHIDCRAGFAGPKSTVGGGLRPPPTVDLSIDVDLDLVVIIVTVAAVAIVVAMVDLVRCTGARVFSQ